MYLEFQEVPEVWKVKKIHNVWVLKFVTSGSTTYTKLLLNGKYQHHADFQKLSHRAAQRQSTFALTPSVATTSTVCAREPKRAEYWVAEETFLSFFQADNAGSALSSSCEPRARARRRALTEQQPLPALRHAAASSTRTFDQDWELFQNKSQLLCALYSGIIIPCKFRQVKCQNWHPLDTRPNFDGFWPLASGQTSSFLFRSCSNLNPAEVSVQGKFQFKRENSSNGRI